VTGPILVPCLVALRSEFNHLAPARDRGADGWIGDKAHQQESSDHNPDETGRTPYEDADNVDEVHALDVDKDLGAGLAMNPKVEIIWARCVSGAEQRLQNIIWAGHIASRSWGWAWRPYTGPSKHFDHAHFSARYVTALEANTDWWGIYPATDPREDLPVEPAEFNKLMDGWAKTKAGLAYRNGLLSVDLGAAGGSTFAQAVQNTEINTSKLLERIPANTTE
jgi:hypothetical protein